MKSFYYKQPYADEQVRATISGEKTLMVFPVNLQPKTGQYVISRIACSTDRKERGKYRWVITNDEKTIILKSSETFKSPFDVGERYWLKESFRLSTSNDCACYDPCKCATGSPIYRSDSDDPSEYAWRPSIHMPQWASRCTIEVKQVYVKRLREINEEECKKFGARFTDFGMKCWHYGGVKSADGCPHHKETHQQNNGWHILDALNSDYCLSTAKNAVRNWFEYKINSESWLRNDWCWFVEFEVVK